MSVPVQRRAAGANEQVLSQYDDHVMDEQEQEQVIDTIRQDNEKANYWYRMSYLSPVPAYILGKHPKSHMTLLFVHHQAVGTVDDLTYLPAFPIYVVVASLLVYLMFLASYEIADRLHLVKPQEFTFPRQPHPFGTAPWWIVPVLRDLRLQPSKNAKVAEKSEAPEKVELAKVLPPRLTYMGFLWVCTWPIPLMTFGLGAFDDALWWAFPFMATTIHLLIEYWIYKADREALSLSGLRYNYKGA
ncbi:hypothetical protein CBS14141_001474 [Malassezia furfur]|nr:hypothetical protein CBS14141_001474 [Malassezia furfur]